MTDWRWPNFSRDTEMACKCGCGRADMNPAFMDALQAVRDEYARPMRVTSAARCTAHNRAVGGHPRSLHICDAPQHPGQEDALAVDIAVTGADRGALFAIAWTHGFSIGWGRGFLHLDMRTLVRLPQTTFDY